MNKVLTTPIQCQWEKIHSGNYMYIQHAPTEITKNHIYVSILQFTGQALQNAGTGTRKRRIKLKPFFSMHVVIYTVAVAVKIKPKNTQTNTQEKYMMYRSI